MNPHAIHFLVVTSTPHPGGRADRKAPYATAHRADRHRASWRRRGR